MKEESSIEYERRRETRNENLFDDGSELGTKNIQHT